MNAQTRMIVGTVVAGVALLALLWVTAISPKRTESAEVRDNVTLQDSRLADARSQVAAYQASRKQFPGLMSELKRLDVAVPGRGAISSLLRELQHRAKVSSSDLRLTELTSAASTSPDGSTPITPGATTGPGGLAALPFSLEYDGKYFDLLNILQAVRKSVSVRASGDLKIGGRLLTIDGLSFKRETGDSGRTTATINATAYIAPDSAAPQVPAGAPTQGVK
jgi:Tfp pilus assembly protein PilO